MKNWYSIKNQVSEDTAAEISIHDYIGSYNINAKSFLSELKNITNKKITLTMNSLGGSVIDGIAIYNGLREHAIKNNATIHVKVFGMVASISSVIAMAGNKISMPKNTYMMIHNPSAGVFEDADGMRDMADVLDKFGNGLIQTYAARTKMKDDDIKAMMKKETLMTAEEAVAMGFADEVTDIIEVTASFGLENLPQNVIDAYKGMQNVVPPPEKDTKVEIENEGDSLFKEISDMASEMGLTDCVENFLLDVTIQNKVQAKAAMVVARDIKELCVFAKMPEVTNKFISDKKSLDEVRAEILKIKADASDKMNVDNKIPTAKVPTSNAPKEGINANAIYQARKTKKGNKQ